MEEKHAPAQISGPSSRVKPAVLSDAAMGKVEVDTSYAVGGAKKHPDSGEQMIGQIYQWVINGEKFASESRQLIKGSTVYHTAMEQSGTLKGSFLLRVPQKQEPETSPHYEVENVSANMYRLSMLENSTNLKVWYQKLVARYGAKSVEMEVDYSLFSLDKPIK